MAFLMWRLWKFKIHIDDRVRRWRVQGLNTVCLNLREVIMLWWGADIKKDMKPYYRAIRCFVIWELWRRINKMKHDGKKTSLPRIIHNVTRNIFMLIQLRKPRMRCPPLWPKMLKELDAYRTKMKVTKVIREFPPVG
ncbi:hypothetical protein KY290_035899 [Solanum tuberosum]|uniref:Uncharacterized protein n=1 Tax=Solanum tuberosum TaxID=4113 RepID=A0ABQ7TSX7_SOLTU|nr:hypothetical protein KY290_035899 [Solanum tuberosum]